MLVKVGELTVTNDETAIELTNAIRKNDYVIVYDEDDRNKFYICKNED